MVTHLPLFMLDWYDMVGILADPSSTFEFGSRIGASCRQICVVQITKLPMLIDEIPT